MQAPPPYNPAAKEPVTIHANANLQKDDLKDRQYVLIVDKSGSMSIEDCKDEQGRERSRWVEMQEAVLSFAETMDRLDPDGIDFVLFNDGASWQRGVHQADIEIELKQHYPRSGTLLAPVLQQAFDNHFQEKKGSTVIVVITDGCPSDKSDVITAIVNASRRIQNDAELGIQIIQIGTDGGATAFLKDLDDNLTEKYNCPYDIVDTTSIQDVQARGGLKQALLNAIND